MPNTNAAKKSLRQNKKKREKNLKRKKTLKDTIKKFERMIESGKIDEAENFLPEVYKTIDKMAKVGLIHQNKADRKKSQVAGLLKEAKSGK